MSNLKERLDIITAKEPSRWLENAKWREENSDWLENSAKIALKILRELRAKQMSQKELAQQLDVSPQYVNKIVKGQENLTLETISKIENVLEIQLISIVGFYTSLRMNVNYISPTYKIPEMKYVLSEVAISSYKNIEHTCVSEQETSDQLLILTEAS